MKKINSEVRKSLIISLVISILFVVGIPMIPIFAGKNWVLMAIGIVFVVVGFYGMPLLWISYANKKRTRRVIQAVEEENLYSNQDIAMQLQMKEKEVYSEITKAINKGYLKGYLYNGKELTINNAKKQTKEEKLTIKKCNNCGGKLEKTDSGYHCPYCDMNFTKDEIA